VACIFRVPLRAEAVRVLLCPLPPLLLTTATAAAPAPHHRHRCRPCSSPPPPLPPAPHLRHSFRAAHSVLTRARRFLPTSGAVTLDFMLVTEAAGCSPDAPSANDSVFAAVQAVAAHALNRYPQPPP
jgi:hypothetical protein